MSFFLRYRALLIFALVIPLTGCLFRSRVVEPELNTAMLRSATQQELIDFINAQAARIQTMQATVDIDTSVGGARKGKVTDYQEIRGYVLARKPAMLRMIGLYPVVKNKAFDMVSDGQDFRVYVPAKNRVVVGRNDAETHSANQLENLRPQAIYEALLLSSIDPQDEIAVLENDTRLIPSGKGPGISQAEYVVDVVRKQGQTWFLSRKVVFSRTDLLPHELLIYDDKANLVTDARYNLYKDYNGINFPSQIQIVRPQEEYDITLNMVKLELNAPLTNDQFMLEIPPGSEVVHLGGPQNTSSAVRRGEVRRPIANLAP